MYIMYIIYYIPTTTTPPPPPKKKNHRYHMKIITIQIKTYDIANETSVEIIQMRLDECQLWVGGSDERSFR